MQVFPAFVANLQIKPYGMDTFTDPKRRKEFITLYYRRRDTRLENSVAFASEVVADLARAGVTVTKIVAHYSKLPETGGRYQSHLQFAIGDADGQDRTSAAGKDGN